MLKMIGFDVLFAAAGNAYQLLAVLGICVALWKGKTWSRKLLYAALVIAFFIAPILPEMYRTVEYRSKRAKAEALFEERCKTAGEKIYKTADAVEGVLLMKLRNEEANSSDQFALDDPYGRNCGGEDCIAAYLFDYKMVATSSKPNSSLTPITPRLYRYVDIVDPSTGQRFRYTKESAGSKLTRKVVTEKSPRFGITWNDISTLEDREAWIAGGSLQVIDLETKEVIAERRGYLFDPGQGHKEGARSPWLWARSNGNTCPSTAAHNQVFVSKILKPTKE